MDKISQVLQNIVDKQMAAGVSALIYDKGQEVYFGAFGSADLTTGRPFTRDTIGYIYSMSKVITSAAMLTLYDKGLYDLDEPISKFLPSFSNMQVAEVQSDGSVKLVPAKRPITFRHLFTMTSGLPYPHDIKDVNGQIINDAYRKFIQPCIEAEGTDQSWTTRQVIDAVASCPLCFHPGEKWLYGLSSDVLGALVEVLSGKEFGTYLQDTFFNPLGMVDTGFSVPQEKLSRLATIYTKSGNSGLVPFIADPKGIPMVGTVHIQSGGGGLVSTIDDYARFARMLLAGGSFEGKTYLKPETIKMMASDQLTPEQKTFIVDPNEAGYSYGLSVRVMCDPVHSLYADCVGAYGWNGMAGTSVRIDPAKDRILLFFIQRTNSRHEHFISPLSFAIEEVLPK